eukprot:356396-Chlamydomonas_euryale.AAC.9
MPFAGAGRRGRSVLGGLSSRGLGWVESRCRVGGGGMRWVEVGWDRVGWDGAGQVRWDGAGLGGLR